MQRLRLALNRYAFHWSFPEIVADEDGLFRGNGIEVDWYDATPGSVVNKGGMYTDLLTTGRTDVYHAGEWACINRVLKSPGSWMAARSDPGPGTLNSSFSLFVRGDSGISKPAELAGKKVSIEMGTGSQFTTILDLEKFIPRSEIRLVQTGEPHRRLLALVSGEVDAASMLGPWSDVARALGMRKILQTERTNPTTIVVRKDTDPVLLGGFFKSVNRAIEMIDHGGARLRDLYFERVKSIVAEARFEVPQDKLEQDLEVSKWTKWRAYSSEDFDATYAWMAERGLAEPRQEGEVCVGSYPSETFL